MKPLPFRFHAWLAFWGLGAVLTFLAHEPVAGLGLLLCGPYTLAALEELR